MRPAAAFDWPPGKPTLEQVFLTASRMPLGSVKDVVVVDGAGRRGALAGLRVLALETGTAGPYATMLLADAGADVIKIEETRVEDSATFADPPKPGDGVPRSLRRLEVNRNKRSVVLELNTEAGREAFLQLVSGSDIVFENLSPEVLRDLHLDESVLRAANPSLILVSLSFGGRPDVLPTPHGVHPGSEVSAQARSGLMLTTGEPLYLGFPASDVFAAVLAVVGTLTAVLQRGTTGEGQHVDISQYDAAIVLRKLALETYAVTRREPPAGVNHVSAISGAFRAKDGFLMIAVPGERLWPKFCGGMGRPESANDPRFRTDSDRRQHTLELHAIIEGWLADKTRTEATDLLLRWDIPVAPMQTVAELLRCPHLQARHMLLTVNDPSRGDVVVVGNPIKNSFEPEVLRRAPPGRGQHTRDVLRERPNDRGAATDTTAISRQSPRLPWSPGKRPLEGIRVLTLENFIAGPYASMLLADVGADVIKIEDPRFGDGSRSLGTSRTTEGGERRSLTFVSHNRNKRSVALNLKSRAGREVFLALVRSADVVLQSMRPGLMKEFGLDYSVLHAENPRLVYASVSFCGEEDFLAGPYSGRPGTDSVAQGLSGLALRPSGRTPTYLGFALNDLLAGGYAAAGILQALVQRRASGVGQRIDVSLYDVGIACQMHAIAVLSATGTNLPPGKEMLQFPAGVFPAKDGSIAIESAAWPDLWAAMGHLEPPEPLTFHTDELRRRHEAVGRATLEAWLADKSRDEAVGLLKPRDIVAEPIQTLGEVFADGQVETRRMLLTIQDPAWGELTILGNPIKSSVDIETPARPAPRLGEHTREVLAEVLSLDANALERLVRETAIPSIP